MTILSIKIYVALVFTPVRGGISDFMTYVNTAHLLFVSRRLNLDAIARKVGRRFELCIEIRASLVP